MRPRGGRGTHHRVRIGVLDVVGNHADRIEDLERLGWRHDARARGRTEARRPERLTRGEEAAWRIRPIRGRRNPDRRVISRDRRKSPQFQNTTTPPRASTSGDDRRNQPGGLRSVSSASLSVFHSNRVVVVSSSREGARVLARIDVQRARASRRRRAASHAAPGHPCSIKYRRQRDLALVHVFAFHGHPFSCAHCRTSRCPLFAAHVHVLASHGHRF